MANRAGYNPNDKVSKASKSYNAAMAGFMCGIVTRSIVQPLDVFKIRYQLQTEAKSSAKYQSMRQAFKTVLKEEGMAAFWKGHMAAQYLSAAYITTQFYGVDIFTRRAYTWFPSLNDSGYSRTLVVSFGGFCGATMATLVSFPFDVVRTRTVAQHTGNLNSPKSVYYKSTPNAVVSIIRGETFFGLYKGILPQLLSMGPTAAIQFACYSMFTELYYYYLKDKNELSIVEKFLCGAMSGAVAKTVVYPLDTIRKRLQVQGFAEGRKALGETPSYRGLIDCIKTMYRQEGFLSFYKGYTPGMAKALLSSGLYFSLFEFFKKTIVQKSGD